MTESFPVVRRQTVLESGYSAVDFPLVHSLPVCYWPRH